MTFNALISDRSVRTWTLSFLLADALFWLFTVYACWHSPADCLEAASFGPFFFYLPFSLLSLFLPSIGAVNDVDLGIVTLPLVGLAFHAVLGAVIGYWLRKIPFRWYMAVPAAFAVLFVLFGFGNVVAISFGWIQ